MNVNRKAWLRIDNDTARFQKMRQVMHKGVINTKNMKF
jgi:hypothetical protein